MKIELKEQDSDRPTLVISDIRGDLIDYMENFAAKLHFNGAEIFFTDHSSDELTIKIKVNNELHQSKEP